MFDIICVFDGSDKVYSIIDFQRLSENEIEKRRYSLICPTCRQRSFYRKKSRDGKRACFGSRDCTCRENTNSPQQQREYRHSIEVKQILLDSTIMNIHFSRHESRSESRHVASDSHTERPGYNSYQKEYINPSNQKRIARVSLEKILHSLICHSGLGTSDITIPIDGFNYKAKNLFVHFSAAQPLEKQALRFYWGTLYNSNVNIEWFNPAECKDVGIPLGNLRKEIIHRFMISDAESLSGAAVIFAGRCYWNKTKTKKIIKICDSERMFVSLLT